MWGSRELLLVWFLVLAVGGTQHIYRPGRRVCAIGVPRGPVSESFVQRVYQPFLTTCDGHRACSTYRTIYRTAYRRSPGPAPARPRYACCPGWKRTSGLPGACGAGEGCGRPGAQSTGVPSDTGPVRQQSIPCSDAGRAPAALLSKPEWSLSWLHGTPSQLPPLQGPGDPPELVTGLPHPQQYASLHARTEGSVSSQAAATALQDGGATPARQTWMNAVLDGAAVPSAVSTPQGVIGASVGRGTAPLRMGQSACPREGLPGSPTRTPQQPTDWKTVPSGVPSGSRPGSLETPHLRWRRDIITFGTRCDTSNSYRE
uniref:EGF like domain multiple 7 n=1 Tax=Equus caballus TaxID=9796 RepID=A0A5F5PQJ0_HORSE